MCYGGGIPRRLAFGNEAKGTEYAVTLWGRVDYTKLRTAADLMSVLPLSEIVLAATRRQNMSYCKPIGGS
jgi:hypothetical protein